MVLGPGQEANVDDLGMWFQSSIKLCYVEATH